MLQVAACRLGSTAGSMIIALSGCGGRGQAPPREGDSGGVAAIAAGPADSLVLTTRQGAEIWYSLSRSSRGATGECIERGLQIRRGGQRIQVPLLYTGETPTLLNDSTMRAVLWTNCRPGVTYRVDLASGRPTPEPGRTR
jgi:hypothetical protein